MNKEDFRFTYSAEGYMIEYKGKTIGGAGIIGKYKGRGRSREQQINSYKEEAEREIRSIINGNGQKRFYEVINKINYDIENAINS